MPRPGLCRCRAGRVGSWRWRADFLGIIRALGGASFLCDERGEVREQTGRTWPCDGAAGPICRGVRGGVARPGVYAGLGSTSDSFDAHVSRWLEAQGLGPAALDECLISQFVAVRRAGGY